MATRSKKEIAVGFCLPGQPMQRKVMASCDYKKVIQKLRKEYGEEVKFLYMIHL